MADATSYEVDSDEVLVEFSQMVRAALLHLYDNAYLQNHPLTAAWAGDHAGDRLTQAQNLRRVLLDSIERLRPQSSAHGDAARAYAVLTYRCVDGLTIEEIEQKLGLSRRQTYREFTKGVDAVAAQLQDLLAGRAGAAEAGGGESGAAPVRHEAMFMRPAEAGGGESGAAPVLSRRELAEEELARLCKEARCIALTLADIVDGVCQLLAARLQRRGAVILAEALAEAPPVLADRTLLRQALLNLLSYALDALPNGATLRMAVDMMPGMVQLVVRQENGADQPGAPFAQVREGVAIAVAHSLIAAQQGRLQIDETPGRWMATIELPLAQTPTVLIIDDNRSLIELFQRYLAGHRVTVIGASSGEEALTLLRQFAPQVIVLDVMMPHQDGWEVLQRLRAAPALAATPIIVCSVLREHDLALSLGASDTLIKPVSQPALLDGLRRWLGTLHPVE